MNIELFEVIIGMSVIILAILNTNYKKKAIIEHKLVTGQLLRYIYFLKSNNRKEPDWHNPGTIDWKGSMAYSEIEDEAELFIEWVRKDRDLSEDSKLMLEDTML